MAFQIEALVESVGPREAQWRMHRTGDQVVNVSSYFVGNTHTLLREIT